MDNVDFDFRTSNCIYTFKGYALPKQTVEPDVTHHIFVIDRSGSMYGDIEILKQSIEQVLTVESMLHGDVQTSLISFSSHGDVTLHWSRVSADMVSALSAPYINELRRIQATAFTGISQGLELALAQVVPGQTTGITLFTDGYANDPSASSEIKALNAFTQKVKDQYTSVFVNVIGYRDWCDWPLMNSIANTLSGTCIKATSFKSVLEAMRDTQMLLARSMRPKVVLDGAPGKTIMVVNRTSGQVNVAPQGESLTLRGVSSEDEVLVYRVESVDNRRKGAKVLPKSEMWLAGAWARGLSSLRHLRAAKEVLFASGNKTLWEEHQASMTPSDIAAMNAELDGWVRDGNNNRYTMGKNTIPPYNLLDFARVLNSLPPKSLGLDRDSFMRDYRRRSIKRIAGTRQEDGTITPANAELVPRTASKSRTYIKSVDFNRSDASVQLTTERAVWVKRLSDGQVFEEVEFVSLDKLRDYASFTLISSGERNIDMLPLEVYTMQAWEALTPFLTKGQTKSFTAGQTVRVNLARFRMESSEAVSVTGLQIAVRQLHAGVAEAKILSAMQDKAASSPYTPAQIEALKALHLTPALYFSAPTTNHYADRDEAVRTGLIDSYTRYTINVGSLDLLDIGEFRSGNAFLDRRYTVTLAGAEVKKPKLDTYLQGATYALKPPGKGKETQADVLMAHFADKLLLAERRLGNDAITQALRRAEEDVECAYRDLQPLVMEMGCTGLLPVELEKEATSYDADAFAAKFDLKLSKDQKEGMFYVIGSLVISVVPETSWYTVRVS